MKILVIGSAGYLGTAITEALLSDGHEVVGLSRGEESPRPYEMRRGDLADPDSLRDAVGQDIEAVVHAATPLGDWDLELASVHAMTAALHVSSARFIYISGTWVLGPSDLHLAAIHTERSPARPIALVRGRERVEQFVLDSPVTGVVVRPGIVHGRGGGIPAMLTSWAAERGRGPVIGDSLGATWPVVHVEDLADLVVTALHSARPGDVLHGIGEEAVAVAAIAAAADAARGGEGVVELWPEDCAAVQLGPPFAEALATSQAVQSSRALELGWRPQRQDIVTDLREGSYRPSSARPLAG